MRLPIFLANLVAISRTRCLVPVPNMVGMTSESLIPFITHIARRATPNSTRLI